MPDHGSTPVEGDQLSYDPHIDSRLLVLPTRLHIDWEKKRTADHDFDTSFAHRSSDMIS